MLSEVINTIASSQNKLYLQQQYGIKHLRVFGSYARNTQTDQSDIDILYTQDIAYQKADPRSFLDVYLLLKKITGKEIDMVTKESLRPELEQSILSSTIQLW